MTFNWLGWKGCFDCNNNDDDVDDDDDDDNGDGYDIDNDNNNDYISAFPQKVKWLLIQK